jgi:hypothetical protein
VSVVVRRQAQNEMKLEAFTADEALKYATEVEGALKVLRTLHEEAARLPTMVVDLRLFLHRAIVELKGAQGAADTCAGYLTRQERVGGS